MKETAPYICIGLAAIYVLALARFDKRKFKETNCITGMLTGFLIGMVIGAAIEQTELISGIGMLAGVITGTFISRKTRR